MHFEMKARSSLICEEFSNFQSVPLMIDFRILGGKLLRMMRKSLRPTLYQTDAIFKLRKKIFRYKLLISTCWLSSACVYGRYRIRASRSVNPIYRQWEGILNISSSRGHIYLRTFIGLGDL